MSRWRARAPQLLGGAVLLLVLAGLYFGIRHIIGNVDKAPRVNDLKVTLIKPPEPKPPEEKPPEPMKQETRQEVPVEQPTEQPPVPTNEPPPADIGSNLGAGDDGFGLGKGNGDGTVRIGGNGSRSRWYAGLVGTKIEQTLNRDSKLLEELKAKRITVRIWVGNSGKVERVEWENGSVPPRIEQSLRDHLLAVTVQEGPAGVEQPIWYRFRPRG